MPCCEAAHDRLNDLDMTWRPEDLVHFTPNYFDAASVVGGGERFVENMAKALRLAAGRSASTSDVISRGSCEGSVHGPSGVVYHLVGDAVDGSLNLDAIRRELRGKRFVMVHQCFAWTSLLVAATAKKMGLLVIGVDHGGGEDDAVWSRPDLTAVYDGFIAQSDFAGAIFRDHWATCEVIKGPVDDALFEIRLEVPVHALRLISVGRILPHKGFEVVVDAMPAETSLLLIGSPVDKDYQSFLEQRADATGKSIEFVMEPDDGALVELVNSASVAVQASQYVDFRGRHYPKPELLGLAPIEALLCGVRVLARRTAALSELEGLPGCSLFEDRVDLAQQLADHLTRLPSQSEREAIRARAIDVYGLVPYGASLSRMLDRVDAS